MNLILCCQTIKNKTEIQYSPSNKQLKVKKKKQILDMRDMCSIRILQL